MSEEILINVTTHESRVAVVEGGMLQEVQVERVLKRGYVGNIYKGRVTRVMPGMEAAFVDAGLDRAGFLHGGDIMPAEPLAMVDGEAPAQEPPINALVHEGQDLVAQVIKDPIGSKGARLSAYLSIPSRYLVLLPHARSVGVSMRIDDEDERQRLRSMLEPRSAERGVGYIARTNAAGLDAEALAEDVAYLDKLWQSLREAAAGAVVGDCIYEELSLPLRALRDLLREDVEKVRIDAPEVYEQARAFAGRFMPALVDRIEHYTGSQPIFDLYGVEDEIKRALNTLVPLKSGGSLVIDQTEAMTTVDVNTARFVGHRNLEETAFRTNLEAAQAAARQMRLRNLGGIIIIDFIDMHDAEHRRQVLRALEKALARDRVKTTVYPISPLGLVEMTRKRTTESLARQLCEACPSCGGRGRQKTTETVTYEIFREIVRAVRQFEAARLLVLASPAVVERITDEESVAVAELQESIGKTIRFQAEDQYAQEQFDVVLL
ncbi:MAG TPA: ribonuclease G [Rhodanobacteraceae bacterium]|nr:ribonuclease G [Rhodanobacteraceae bacterium]